MFTKILKYDIMFSKNIFLGMAAIFIGLAVVVRYANPLVRTDPVMTTILSAGIIISSVLIAIVSILQIFHFYRKNLFGDTGYFMLTLPVTRGNLLASKLVISMVWYVFMIIVGHIVVTIVNPWRARGDILSLGMLIDMLNVVLLGFFFITVLFFAITLANSAFDKIRVHSVVAGFTGFVYTAVYFIAGSALSRRFTEWERSEWLVGDELFYHYFPHPLIGIQYGRVQISYTVLDIYAHLLTLAFAAVAIAATLHLLKKRVDLP